MSQFIELSRQFLSDTGGWKEMKEARAIHTAGRAADVTYRDGVLEGLVREGGKVLKVRMQIGSRTDVVNFCPCFRARRDGIICAHALAAGLEFLEPTERRPEHGTREAAGKATVGALKVVISPDWPRITEVGDETATPARLFLVVAPNLATAWEKGRITVGVEVDLDGDRRLLKSVPATVKLFLDAGDAVLCRVLQQLSPTEVPGVLLV
ncbi:MAG: hypothetical protein KA152_14800, partial [Verrucomicrobiales bacterium]|nr:hypothetical protein [Verrucomicrobiales bacterium]